MSKRKVRVFTIIGVLCFIATVVGCIFGVMNGTKWGFVSAAFFAFGAINALFVTFVVLFIGRQSGGEKEKED